MAKRYGLIISEKSKVTSRPAIFNEDSESDTDRDKPTGISTLKKQERLAQAKLVAQDPTIYQYDELYDEMQSHRKESKLARKDLDRKPKYISKLLDSAQRRKQENERRIEREIQKEREAEGDMFKDKESFVTTAYRKKLEELKKLEEKEKREDYLESIGDVRKQGDLSGFYRHLYEQTVEDKDMEKDKNSEEVQKEVKIEENISEMETSKVVVASGSKIKEENPQETTTTTSKAKENRKRKYRKRESHSSESEIEEVKLEHLPSNIDADSDFSIDSESDSEGESKKVKTNENKKDQAANGDQIENPKKTNEILETSEAIKQEAKDDGKVENKTENGKEEETKLLDTKEVIEVVKKPKIDIWKKRTVGEVFDEAVKRYYERKAARVKA